ncbi:hypothetical protein [uncultured Mediterranean phage uvMED]|nr:hypothetical protein [uncultured Mediterranean phage uvMED]
MEKSNRYLELSRLDCSPGVEVKHGGLSYLSWSYAWHLLVSKHPDSTYYFAEPMTLPDGTMMVKAGVCVEGLTHEMPLPVLDHRNKPLASPNAFDFNSAQMRALVKAIAMHGVGIGMYLGDIKQVVEASNYEKAQQYISAQDSMGFLEFLGTLTERQQVDLFNDDAIPKGKKTAFKNDHRALVKQANDFIDSVAECISEATEQQDEELLRETIAELSSFERTAVWGRLNEAQQSFITSTRK